MEGKRRMLTIGQFAKKAQVTARTLRFYEQKGLIPAAKRGENNYRAYNENLVERVLRIKSLQAMGFNLVEVAEIFSLGENNFDQHLLKQIERIEKEIADLNLAKKRIEEILSISKKFNRGENITSYEREVVMELVRNEVLKKLQDHYDPSLQQEVRDYLLRDQWLYGNPQLKEYFAAIQSCVEFAKKNDLIIGPGRGSMPASLSIFSLGLSGIDPLLHNLIPERLETQKLSFHIDVEYERGQIFVDYCTDLSRKLEFADIQAFKMPLIDIVKKTQGTFGKQIDFDVISDDSTDVLKWFRTSEIEKIFQFDFSHDSLVMKYENFFPEYFSTTKLKEFLSGQKISSFKEIVDITALWRPSRQGMVDRINAYKQAKIQVFCYDFLHSDMQAMLKPQFGRIIYHEDLIHIIRHYSGWSLAKANLLRRKGLHNPDVFQTSDEWQEFKQIAPPEVVQLVAEEVSFSFCKPHALVFAKFTKQTCVLKSLCPQAYYQEIEKFEAKHGIRWDDIGIRIKGVSLHQ